MTSAQDEVVELCSELIRFDTSNPTSSERAAAEWVTGKLDGVGVASRLYESEPGRASVVARIEGTDQSRPALLLHGHLDVVPADPGEWSVHPFSGEERDGFIWGRGAIDMKDMDAMLLAMIRQWARTGERPPRDVVVAFVADEEAGGVKGARFLVDNHSEEFEGCTEAISEVGGFSVTLPGRSGADVRMYPIQTAEKGMAWLRLLARGRPGHGSMRHEDNAVTRLAEAVARIGRYEFPVVMTKTVRQFLEALAEQLGVDIDLDAADRDEIEALIGRLGGLALMVGATLSNTANPTMLEAGYKSNVIPSTGSAVIDGRFLPGEEEEFERQVDALVGSGVVREWVHRDQAVETDFDGPLVEAMAAALRAEDSAALPVPYTMSGGTDAKSFERLGMRCFGFSPLLLPADLDFAPMFHGIDERVPTDALTFGVRVLQRFVAAS
ncbi:MAG TPA: M20/M25/M40 family metallo-hydrolase [Mycobacteriales bacterium]|jgi:acetylornithine deacetylase/succinyl-diaminopimelate desuccinylase-like protein|nr:M20/M25/M40 family metallo-hydrolase [Mycobacteriales bacterium]